MISPASVLRDLERGETVRRKWAPEAVDALVADGSIVVRQGIARFPKWSKARARDRRAREILPATCTAVARALGLSVVGARVVLVRIGARPSGVVHEPDVRGYRRPRATWAMP